MGLLQNFHQPASPGQLSLGGFIQVASELGEGGHLAVLGQIQPQAPGHLLHGLDLGVAADPRNRKTHVDGRADAGIEQFRFQINLPVGNGNHVGGNIGGHVPGLGFDDGQRRQGPPAQSIAHFGRSLQEAGVQIEDVARISFAPRRTAEKQGKLAVGLGMLGKVVVNAQGVAPRIPEILAHGAPRIRGDVLQRRRVRGRRRHYGGIFHRPVFPEDIHHARYGRPFLPDGDIEAIDSGALLVDDRIDGNGRLAGPAVADDQLALSPADGDHGVDGLQAGLQGLFHRHAGDDSRGLLFDVAEILGLDGGAFIERLA